MNTRPSIPSPAYIQNVAGCPILQTDRQTGREGERVEGKWRGERGEKYETRRENDTFYYHVTFLPQTVPIYTQIFTRCSENVNCNISRPQPWRERERI